MEPIKINNPPKAVFMVKLSDKNKAAKINTKMILKRSNATTPVAGPIFKAANIANHDKAPATPEATMNNKALLFNVLKYENFPDIKVKVNKKLAITIDRMVVAKVLSIPCKPIFPKIATAEANTADKIPKTIQDIKIRINTV